MIWGSLAELIPSVGSRQLCAAGAVAKMGEHASLPSLHELAIKNACLTAVVHAERLDSVQYTRVPTPPSVSPSGAHESHPARVLGSGPLSPPLTPSHPIPAQPPPELLTGVEVVPGADDELRLHAAGNALHQTCRGDLR